jgi:hypothetical protein
MKELVVLPASNQTQPESSQDEAHYSNSCFQAVSSTTFTYRVSGACVELNDFLPWGNRVLFFLAVSLNHYYSVMIWSGFCWSPEV